MNEKSKFIAEKNSERLDKLLTELFKDNFDFSRSMIQKLIEQNLVTVNGEIAASQKMAIIVGDIIEVTIPEAKKTEITAEKIEFEIIYEDADILVINKPNDLVVHPGAGNRSGTLVNGLLDAIEDLSSIGGVERPGIVHRLDKQTTGLLIVAKNDKSHRVMSEMIANHEVYKEYIALVWGNIEPSKGIIDAPIGRHPNDRKKMVVTSKHSKSAKTNFEVIENFEYSNTALIKCNIETGRTHQIRVHFNFIKHPIVGDPTYGRINDKDTKFGQFLHASKLIFNHPITKERMEFEAPIPDEFNDKIKELRGK
ncbi:23S rRNA pseudouridine1911/1915/1917 synthase [Williamsoniiplasma somnilux]|uniref:Pseudouridine synthase n=1 Tax=Williamsoniiplasma somnilux TaxID=215578 RepID=A0A2K8NY56_9MOLU|nr:RluA family pseudouridine synthase [Williamsoniiplasma somnilux]ATZ18674.1 23S rRNA pseudouridine1911/1915/1917 synthase [Williamsoniiplasma somnilux]